MKFLLISAAVAVTPVEKVVQLLNGMLEKGKEEKHAEEVQYGKYLQWCQDTQQKTQQDITDGNEKIEMLQADIQKYQANANALGKEIAIHEGDIAVWNGDIKAANKVRDLENTDFVNTDRDYDESLIALEKAIQVLQRQDVDRPQLIQTLQSVIPLAGKHQAITAFLSQSEENLVASLDTPDAPSANAYEFQSQSVVDMLKKLKEKFQDERTTLNKEEANAKHAHSLLMQDMEAKISEATRQRTQKSEGKAANLQSKGEATSELHDTTATRDDDQTFLQKTTATCTQKAADFESRQTLRAGEITAIEKAIEILSADDVKGAAEKHLPTLVQRALLQLRGRKPLTGDEQAQVADYLRIKGAKLHSRVLSALAVRVEEDPFQKVKKMIKDLIVRLMEEANEEAEHKGWCDKELKANEHTRKEKTSQVEKLHSESDALKAAIAKLSDEVATLTQEVTDLQASVKEATTNRAAEKVENTATIKDAKDAQVAVSRALQVLQDFYAKAGQATALVQQRPEAPAVFDRPYQGMQAENGGVIGMLEVIQSDFARLESETTASEEQGQREFEEFVQNARVNKEQKNKDIEHKTFTKQNREQALQETTSDLEGTQKELDAALNYYDSLKPDCIDDGLSYEDRVQKRKEEVESLQEALKILNGEMEA